MARLTQPRKPAPRSESPPIALKDFLETVAPNSARNVVLPVKAVELGVWQVLLPSVWIYCSHKQCQGRRWFDPESTPIHRFGADHVFNDVGAWKFVCRHCKNRLKTFAVLCQARQPSYDNFTDSVQSVTLTKIGEIPAFGVPAPLSLRGFLEDDAELFEKALKSEAQGLGIGALVYYRRIVDNQKPHLLQAIRSVYTMEGGTNAGVSDALTAAEAADGFSRAYEALKGHIPASLRVSGHDPLQLLYDQTSHGLHNLSDADCLARATTIREVLAAMASRVQELLKEHAALSKAVGELSQLDKDRGPAAPDAGGPPSEDATTGTVSSVSS